MLNFKWEEKKGFISPSKVPLKGCADSGMAVDGLDRSEIGVQDGVRAAVIRAHVCWVSCQVLGTSPELETWACSFSLKP